MTFDQFYDATDGFKRKSAMRRLYANQVQLGDVVLVEAALTRYKTGQNRMRWEEWGTTFELQSVCVLAKNPEKVDSPESFVAEAAESDVKL